MSATKRDYYEVLGIGRAATEDEVRRAYRKLARQFHPDVNKAPDAEAMFKEINEAYEVLSDVGKRSAYDRFGHAGIENGMGTGAYSPFGASPLSDIFEILISATRTSGHTTSSQGANVVVVLSLTLDEMVFGVERLQEVSRLVRCATCGGSGAASEAQVVRCTSCNGNGTVQRIRGTIFGGQVLIEELCAACQGKGTVITAPCPTCAGAGRVRENSRVKVKIPAGLSEGQRILMAGEGDAGLRGAPSGDLYIEFEVKPHKLFRRKGYNILLDLTLNVAQASLGAELQVQTLDGPQELKIPPGTQHDKVFVMRGRGVPHLRSTERGDQLVRVQVHIPTNLNEEQRRLMGELARSFGDDPPGAHEERGFFERLKDAFS